MLTVEIYDQNERTARSQLSQTEIWAFETTAFSKSGFPSRALSNVEIALYADFGNHGVDCYQYFIRDYLFQGANLWTMFSSEEHKIISEISNSVADLTDQMCRRRMRPISSLLSQVGLFRTIMAIKEALGRESLFVLEVGPASGYLGALLIKAGIRYTSTDNAQAFYMYQSRLLESLLREQFCDWALTGKPANPEAYQAHHLPWWEYVRLQKDDLPRVDVFVSNANLREMNAGAMKYTLRLAATMLHRSDGLFLFNSFGEPVVSSRAEVEREFAKLGLEQLCNKSFYAFGRQDHCLRDGALHTLDTKMPLYDPRGSGQMFDAGDVLCLGRGDRRELPADIPFLSYIDVFCPPEKCYDLDSELRSFFSESPYPEDIDTARQILKAWFRIRHHLRPGNLYIYNLSQQTKSLIKMIRQKENVAVLGIVDDNASPQSSFDGMNVIPPHHLQHQRSLFSRKPQFDYILVSHETLEMNLARRLLDIGIPSEKIEMIHAAKPLGQVMETPESKAYMEVMLAAWRGLLPNYGRN